jgi:hypothetical protein
LSMNMEEYQEVHTCVGVMLCTVAKKQGVPDVTSRKVINDLQDNLNNRLFLTPIKNLSDLYEAIHATVNAVKGARIIGGDLHGRS